MLGFFSYVPVTLAKIVQRTLAGNPWTKYALHSTPPRLRSRRGNSSSPLNESIKGFFSLDNATLTPIAMAGAVTQKTMYPLKSAVLAEQQ
jgi:hypothetical protein